MIKAIKGDQINIFANITKLSILIIFHQYQIKYKSYSMILQICFNLLKLKYFIFNVSIILEFIVLYFDDISTFFVFVFLIFKLNL